MKHSLVEIYASGPEDEQHVVRWCRVCGAIVVDVDVDGRPVPGAIMKMTVPQMTQSNHCRKQKDGNN